MKRSHELIPLSREHNLALKLARDARRTAANGSESDVSEIWRQLSRCWYTEMADHFRAEEELIFPRLRQMGAAALAGELEREHQAMRKALEDPKRQDRTRLDAIGQVLNEHIRREERVAFPLVEAGLDRESRQRLGMGIKRILGAEEEAPA